MMAEPPLSEVGDGAAGYVEAAVTAKRHTHPVSPVILAMHLVSIHLHIPVFSTFLLSLSFFNLRPTHQEKQLWAQRLL